jgi:hypothetical protein
MVARMRPITCFADAARGRHRLASRLIRRTVLDPRTLPKDLAADVSDASAE